MIDVGPINPWELFKMLYAWARQSRNSATSFSNPAENILSSSKRISTRRSASQMKALMKSRTGKKKSEKWKLERQSYQVTDHSYKFPPRNISSPIERAPVKKLVFWLASSIQNLYDLDWLNLYKHIWE